MVSLMSDMPAKRRAHALLDELPDSSTWSNILCALELAAEIDEGLDLFRGRELMEAAEPASAASFPRLR